MNTLQKITLLGIVVMLPTFLVAQSTDSTGSFGIAINSSVNGELYPFRLVPSVTYLKNKSQFELGVGMHPFIREDQRLISGEFNYKYFPNGTEQKYSTYLISRLSYVNNFRDTYYSSRYNYLFLNAGYGINVSPFKGAYLGTNVSLGAFSYSKRSENPYPGASEMNFGEHIGFNLAFQFNIGYRF